MAPLLLALALVGSAVAPAAGSPLCADDTRLDIMRFPLHYRGARDALQAAARETGRSALDVLRDDGGDDERCLWNRFLFLDFTLYFGLTGDLLGDTPPVDAARVRDALFARVATHVVDGTDQGFAEWASADLEGERLDTFLARGSERFATLERAIALVHAPSAVGVDDDAAAARLVAHRATGARTPFSAIAVDVALHAARDPRAARELSALVDALARAPCTDDVYRLARDVTHDDGRALLLLGVFASQRMYLLRDLAAHVRATSLPDVSAPVLAAFAAGARAFFAIETRGLSCGAPALYPPDVDGQSGKPYHFFAVAHLAFQLRRAGYAEDTAAAAAVVDAGRYKDAIRVPGMAWNALLRRPLDDGTAGDGARVRAEHALGARFGLARFVDAARARPSLLVHATRRVRLAPDDTRVLVDVAWDEARSSTLLVTVRERAPRLVPGVDWGPARTRVLRFDLGPGRRHAHRAAGLGVPAVKLRARAITVLD